MSKSNNKSRDRLKDPKRKFENRETRRVVKKLLRTDQYDADDLFEQEEIDKEPLRGGD